MTTAFANINWYYVNVYYIVLWFWGNFVLLICAKNYNIALQHCIKNESARCMLAIQYKVYPRALCCVRIDRPARIKAQIFARQLSRLRLSQAWKKGRHVTHTHIRTRTQETRSSALFNGLFVCWNKEWRMQQNLRTNKKSCLQACGALKCRRNINFFWEQRFHSNHDITRISK